MMISQMFLGSQCFYCMFYMLPNAICGTGMCAADHTKDTFMELKRKKIYRYLVFRIDEKKREVVVEK
ncbi:hypothetical protein V6N12_058858 [Hibiscus sabdariffa]|uniref:ADF-H domain-containing protein n=1 Tax=Hibiscus sabdariffa TaxID=183260 RepID=A0ABR2EXC5_9ROSI